MVADNSKPMADDARGQGQSAPAQPETAILADPHHTRADCRMVERAVRRGWDVPAETKDLIKARLVGIVSKESVTVLTAGGSTTVEAPADANAIAASRVLVRMDEIDQADDHLALKTERLDTNLPTENIVIAIPPPILERASKRG